MIVFMITVVAVISLTVKRLPFASRASTGHPRPLCGRFAEIRRKQYLTTMH